MVLAIVVGALLALLFELQTLLALLKQKRVFPVAISVKFALSCLIAVVLPET
jgi:hypothetical protein